MKTSRIALFALMLTGLVAAGFAAADTTKQTKTAEACDCACCHDCCAN